MTYTNQLKSDPVSVRAKSALVEYLQLSIGSAVSAYVSAMCAIIYRRAFENGQREPRNALRQLLSALEHTETGSPEILHAERVARELVARLEAECDAPTREEIELMPAVEPVQETCPIAERETRGAFRCTRSAHDGPRAAVPNVTNPPREGSELGRVSCSEPNVQSLPRGEAGAWDEGYKTGHFDGKADERGWCRKHGDKNPYRRPA